MTERTLKYSLGPTLVVSHLALIGYSIYLYFQHGFAIDEFTTVAAIIGPMFAGFTTAILTFIVKNARVLSETSPPVTTIYAIFSFGLPLLLAGTVAMALGLKAHNQVFANFEDFKRFVLLVESLFATYAGLFVYSLFDKVPPAKPND